MGGNGAVMRGVVTAGLEARIALSITGPRGDAVTTDAIVDTGFTEHLTLPPDLIRALGLAAVARDRGTLADGRTADVEVYECVVLWDGRERRTSVLCLDSSPLLGMSLLLGQHLSVDVLDGGAVAVEALA